MGNLQRDLDRLVKWAFENEMMIAPTKSKTGYKSRVDHYRKIRSRKQNTDFEKNIRF
jgi:hypothetical protein